MQNCFLPSNNLCVHESSSRIAKDPSVDVRLQTSGNFQTMITQTNSNVQKEGFELMTAGADGLKPQDSFGRWVNYVVTESPDSLDNLPVESPISNGHGSSITGTMNHHHHSSVREQVFTITEISPAWALSTEETKVFLSQFILGVYVNLFNYVHHDKMFIMRFWLWLITFTGYSGWIF